MPFEDTGTHHFGHNEQNSEKPTFRSKYLSQSAADNFFNMHRINHFCWQTFQKTPANFLILSIK